MCLYLIYYKKSHQEQTATEDMVVYKVIKKNNESMFRCFQYEPNQLYRLRKKLKVKMKKIHEGFHSFTSFLIARNNLPQYGLYKIVKFIIPKGAKYYLGMSGDIVSTSIRSSDLIGIKD